MAEGFECIECGYFSPRWLGRCPTCGNWNTLNKTDDFAEEKKKKKSIIQAPLSIDQILEKTNNESRFSTGDQEFDILLGGGLVKGSIILVGGEPGIGKSTLLITVANNIAEKGLKTLYISAEESISQVGLRAKRMNINSPNLLLFSGSSVQDILAVCHQQKPAFVVVDSIQTIHHEGLSSGSGSPVTVRATAALLAEYSKGDDGPAVVLVGHITKDGSLAGPRVLEHLVDVVFMFDGTKSHPYRVLRVGKNRFGPSDGVVFYNMTDMGLQPILDATALLIGGRKKRIPGTVVTSCMEGNKAILAEIQALIIKSYTGISSRFITGLDATRSMMILAVLGKRCGISGGGHDIYLNVAGGYKISDTASDLAIAVACASSIKDMPFDNETIAIGEISLTGELRAVHHMEKRLNEAKRAGFKRGIIPKSCGKIKIKGIDIIGADYIDEAVDLALVQENMRNKE